MMAAPTSTPHQPSSQVSAARAPATNSTNIIGVPSRYGTERQRRRAMRRVELGGRGRKTNGLELTLRPERNAVAVARADRIPRLSTRIGGPRAQLGSELDDHAPARTGRSRPRRRTERARPTLPRNVERRQRGNSQQVIHVRVTNAIPAPPVAVRIAVLLAHALERRDEARGEDVVPVLHRRRRAVVPPHAAGIGE